VTAHAHTDLETTGHSIEVALKENATDLVVASLPDSETVLDHRCVVHDRHGEALLWADEPIEFVIHEPSSLSSDQPFLLPGEAVSPAPHTPHCWLGSTVRSRGRCNRGRRPPCERCRLIFLAALSSQQ
jgi:hypothetical protein